MPGKILGLDIDDDSISAVRVESGLKGYKIVACARVDVEGDGDQDDALRRLLDQMEPEADTCIASIPGKYVSYRNLQMPFKDMKKIRQTVPFEIETMVPFPIEELLVDFTITDRSDQSGILAACVKRSYISEFLARLKSYGIDPDVLDIRCAPTVSWLLGQVGTPDNGLFLDIGKKRTTMVLHLNRRIALIRTFVFNGEPIGWYFSHGTSDSMEDELVSEKIGSCLEALCTTVQNTIHYFGGQSKRIIRPEKIFFTGMGALYPETASILRRFFDVETEQINLSNDVRINIVESAAQAWNPALMDDALALAIRDVKRDQGFNFRRDEFEVRKQYFALKKELRKVAISLIIILLCLAADMGVSHYFLKKRYNMLDQKISEIFKQAFPDVKRVVDPVQQMKVKINEIVKSSGTYPGGNSSVKMLDLLRDISERVSKSLDVDVTRMVIDPETVRVSGSTDTFNTVDNIKTGLEPSAYFSGVTISSANLDRTGKRVKFEIKLQRAH